MNAQGETRPRMLILLYTRLAREPRAHKQIAHFSKIYDVTTVGYGRPEIEGVRHIELPDPVVMPVLRRKVFYAIQALCFKMKLYGLGYRFVALNYWAWKRLSREQWDVIIAHDVNTIPLANRLRPKHGVLADMHEYAPRQYEHSAEWVRITAPYYRWICAHELTRAKAVVTVSRGIVEEYRKEFGISAELVINATPAEDLPAGEVGDTIRLVHSGLAAPARKLEIMVDAVLAARADASLDLYLVNTVDPSYLEQLKERAGGSERIRFHEAVPYSELVRTLNRYDIGLSIIVATTFNHEHCLPNKFFDYVQARLGQFSGPSPEMARLIEEYEMGEVLEDFEAATLTAALDDLSAETVRSWKQNADQAAEVLTGESQALELERIVRGMIEA